MDDTAIQTVEQNKISAQLVLILLLMQAKLQAALLVLVLLQV